MATQGSVAEQRALLTTAIDFYPGTDGEEFFELNSKLRAKFLCIEDPLDSWTCSLCCRRKLLNPDLWLA